MDTCHVLRLNTAEDSFDVEIKHGGTGRIFLQDSFFILIRSGSRFFVSTLGVLVNKFFTNFGETPLARRTSHCLWWGGELNAGLKSTNKQFNILFYKICIFIRYVRVKMWSVFGKKQVSVWNMHISYQASFVHFV